MAVLIKDMIDDLGLEVIVTGKKDAKLNVSDLNRPGLQFGGFYDYFANARIQVVGMAEWSFLESLNSKVRNERLQQFFSFNVPCVIISRGLDAHDELIEHAKKSNTYLLRSTSLTTKFISKITTYLSEKLAPETRVHGVLVDVYGVGILITGESGIGKSETALELIKRGHRLISDDAVDIREIDGDLIGSSPFITSGMMEVRGMGIIDVAALYGMSSILVNKTIKLVICLEQWKSDGNYERLGVDNQFIDILNTPIKKITLPIRPGRNIAVIVETAAVNYTHSLMSDVSPIDIIDQRMEKMVNANQ